ncbi:hypothetical protein [Streptomyces sp. AK08-02]|uniref:hypothetical protein n=1 Tax=Streptomyces sp. AK08-02 TaxID=3028654 RepID=UPI0029B5B477|nr:hypothetical protein [Streptomyces sp. AK08-02]MDX3748711.1 hypothetical protein [Streptomyces sp. AK08-02]
MTAQKYAETSEWAGIYGTAVRIPADAYTDAPATIDFWIITGPHWSPAWTQYMLGIVTLADVAGVDPARLQRPGVTHELLVVALDPDHGPYDAGKIRASQLHTLRPVNVCEQFTATDGQARDLAVLCAKACVDGHLSPEPGDGAGILRAGWRHSIEQTLEHPHHHTAPPA